MEFIFKISDNFYIKDYGESPEDATAFIEYCKASFAQLLECPQEPQKRPVEANTSKYGKPASQQQLDIMRDYKFEPWPDMTKREAYAVVRALLRGEQIPEREAIPTKQMNTSTAPATDKQKATMRKFNIPFDENITSGEASQLITESIERAR